jgi:hypothetical protein
MTTKHKLLNKIVPLKDDKEIDLWYDGKQYFEKEYRIDKGYSIFIRYNFSINILKYDASGCIQDFEYKDLEIEDVILCYKDETEDYNYFNKKEVELKLIGL